MQKIVPHLWFDKEAEEAAEFYTSIFKDSMITTKTHYAEAGQEVHGQAPGTVMTVVFELQGQQFMALNAGPLFKFNESISFLINCDTQEEIDYYWEKLTAGGDEKAQQCGWLKDKFGLSWQVVPNSMGDFMSGPGAGKAMAAMLKMKKIDMNELKRAREEA